MRRPGLLALGLGTALVLEMVIVHPVALAGPPPASAKTRTLRGLLRDNRIEAGALDPAELDRPITSAAVENTDDLFVAAWYPDNGTPLLSDALRISALDKAAKTWMHATLPRRREAGGTSGPSWEIGSIEQIHHSKGRIFLDTHGNPSAGTLLVLTRTLQPVAALDGWLLLLLPDDRALYERSMIHFAPTHAAELWIYDAGSGRDARLYPVKPYAPTRLRYIETVRRVYAALGEKWFRENNRLDDPEEFDSSILPPLVAGGRGTAVAFIVRLGSTGTLPGSTPPLDLVVVCEALSTAGPRCRETELQALRQTDPGRSNRQLLVDAVAR